MTDTSGETSCGFVALLGAPNAGKSTLINSMVGAKVSIVTQKVQTTRTRILGVTALGDAQLVFVDTPGIFKPRRRLDRAMVAAAWSGAADADGVALLIDAGMRLEGDTRRIIDGLKQNEARAVCVLNKIDTVPRENLLALIEELRAEDLFTDFFMVSALKGEGVEELKQFFAGRLPKGPWHFPADQLSDMNDRLFSAEITREKLFLNLHQELPYALTVETETWEPGKYLNVGHFMLALDPARFGGGFGGRMDRLIDMLHDTPPADPAQPVLVPGDPEHAQIPERQANGIPVVPKLFDELCEVAAWAGADIVISRD